MPSKLPPASLPSFLGPAQQALSQSASRADVDKANDEALQQGIQASLHHDDGLTAAQKFARETGNPELIAEANKAAIDEAIAASMREAKTKAVSVRRNIPDQEFAEHRGLIAKLKQWLTRQGFIVRPNTGNSNNCLLISMLQHVTGDYSPDSQHISAKAARYKALIADWSGGRERDSSSLFSDDQLTELIVEQINQDHFGADRKRHIQFRFIAADIDGKPAERYVGNGHRIAGILDGGGHYEAFVERRE